MADVLAVRVWGELACFTREMKVERVSYPVMTPTAARGVLEAIFWKPEFQWRVLSIAALKPIHYVSITRNEISDHQSFKDAQKWMKKGGGYFADDDEHRTPRHTRALRDVAYLITAAILLRPHATDPTSKYREQFLRRMRRGQCFQRPYLGCREFAADFAEPDGSEHPIDLTGDLGTVLLDIDYATDGSGRGTPRFFQARLQHGVLHVPALGERKSDVPATAC
jgi:CRISPR-associated protein Cas5d